MNAFLAILEPVLVNIIQTEGPQVLGLVNGLLGKLAQKHGVALEVTPAHTAPQPVAESPVEAAPQVQS